MYEKIFQKDAMTKRERIERMLNHESTDRVPLHDQISYNSGVLSQAIGRSIQGFDYSAEDIGLAISKTLDACFPVIPPCGEGEYTDDDGFTFKNDNWTKWHVGRPFHDEHGAKDWLCRRIQQEKAYGARFDADAFRASYREYMLEQQRLVGETVVIDYSIGTGFCDVFDRMGLENFTFFELEYPEVMSEYMETASENAVKKVHAAADLTLSPVVLIAEDFSTKQGPIFSPAFLRRYHYPYVKRLTEAWKEHGLKVLYHSDGNYKPALPDLMGCGVDGFYCLETNCGMDIVELKKAYPDYVWAGGVDGVDLMERGTPEQVIAEVRRHIIETNALSEGGMMIGSSSEINPPIKPDNFFAMVETAGTFWNL